MKRDVTPVTHKGEREYREKDRERERECEKRGAETTERRREKGNEQKG